MKVLDLHCSNQHTFEGWFGSEADFQSQLSRGLIDCPLCADKTITKMLSAPRLNFGAAKPVQEPLAPPRVTAPNSTAGTSSALTIQDAADVPSPAPLDAKLQAAWLATMRQVVANTEDVGNQFAEEARKMHYGEAKERGIRGHATRDETEALLDEGIAIMPIRLPTGMNGPLQ